MNSIFGFSPVLLVAGFVGLLIVLYVLSKILVNVGAKEIAADKKLSLAMATKRDSITVFEPIADAEGVEPFVKLPDGQWLGAKVSRTDPETKKTIRAVVLGFYLADVANADDRRALLKEALRFLEANPEKPENPTYCTVSATASDAAPAAAPATGAGQQGGG